MITALLNGSIAQCASGSHKRDFMHSADIGRAFTALASSDYQGPVNIASGKPYTLAEVVKVIAEQLDKKPSVKISHTTPTPDNPAVLIADTTILKNILGFNPKFNLQNGIADTIAWWRANPRNFT